MKTKWYIMKEPSLRDWRNFIIRLIVISLLFIILLLSVNYKESSAEKIIRIQEEIFIVQQENIALANIHLDQLNIEKEIVMTNLWRVMNDITIYKNCIMLNKTGDLPVNCSTITLSLKQRLNWKVNSAWYSQEFKPLSSNTHSKRMKELLNKYPYTKWTYWIWIQYSKQYNINPAVAIAIAKADSSLGNNLKTTNNIGNVGNSDNGNTITFTTKNKWIEAIYIALTNQYLWKIYTVWYLSEWGRRILWAASCNDSGEYCYATSEENWNINVINTLRLIYNDPSIDENFNIRN